MKLLPLILFFVFSAFAEPQKQYDTSPLNDPKVILQKAKELAELKNQVGGNQAKWQEWQIQLSLLRRRIDPTLWSETDFILDLLSVNNGVITHWRESDGKFPISEELSKDPQFFHQARKYQPHIDTYSYERFMDSELRNNREFLMDYFTAYNFVNSYLIGSELRDQKDFYKSLFSVPGARIFSNFICDFDDELRNDLDLVLWEMELRKKRGEDVLGLYKCAGKATQRSAEIASYLGRDYGMYPLCELPTDLLEDKNWVLELAKKNPAILVNTGYIDEGCESEREYVTHGSYRNKPFHIMENHSNNTDFMQKAYKEIDKQSLQMIGDKLKEDPLFFKEIVTTDDIYALSFIGPGLAKNIDFAKDMISINAKAYPYFQTVLASDEKTTLKACLEGNDMASANILYAISDASTENLCETVKHLDPFGAIVEYPGIVLKGHNYSEEREWTFSEAKAFCEKVKETAYKVDQSLESDTDRRSNIEEFMEQRKVQAIYE